jgi:hypothetical protein
MEQPFTSSRGRREGGKTIPGKVNTSINKEYLKEKSSTRSCELNLNEG